MSLVTVAEARALVNTGLSDGDLQVVIDRIEADITSKVGAPQTDAYATEVVKTLRGEGENLFLPTEIYSVVSIVEDTVTLTADQYQTWGGGVIERLPMGSSWGDRVVVTYKPKDDRPVREDVIIDLLRLTLNRTGMKSESIAGEYSYTAFDSSDAEYRKVMKRLMFQAL